MKANFAIACAVLSGLCGAAAVEGLHAQTKARKAYTVSELQTLDAKLAADVAMRITKAQELSGGHNMRTSGGKVTVLEGPPPPDRIAITEWESLEKARAFYGSKAWNELGPDREKALKTIRRYAVEERD